MTLASRPLKLVCMLLPCMLVLAGCQTTRFQSRPGGTYSDCDPAWVGSWRVMQEQAEGGVDQLGTLVIPTSCQPMTLHESGKPPEGFDEYAFEFATVGRMHLLVGSESNVTTDKETGKPSGMMVFRYDASPRRITIYGIDHALVARRIVEGTLPGHTEASSRAHLGQDHSRQAKARSTSIENLIEGDGDGIAALLQAEPTLFTAQPVLELERAPDQRAATQGTAP